MKHVWICEISKSIRLLAVLGLIATPGVASTMRPSVIVHGEVRDAFGSRPRTGVQVSAFLGSNEVARTTVSIYPQGENYRLLLDVYDPATATMNQVVPDDEIEIKVKVGTTYQPVIGTNSFSVTGDGTPVELDLMMGTDTDGDGLPDEWERMVIANSGGLAKTLADVGPGKDLDGDGMDDDEEFWYGSFAFLPGDELRFSLLQRHNDRYSFMFLSVMDVVYGVDRSPRLILPVWLPCGISLSPDGALSPNTFRGNGDFMTVFFDAGNSNVYYRLQAR